VMGGILLTIVEVRGEGKIDLGITSFLMLFNSWLAFVWLKTGAGSGARGLFRKLFLFAYPKGLCKTGKISSEVLSSTSVSDGVGNDSGMAFFIDGFWGSKGKICFFLRSCSRVDWMSMFTVGKTLADLCGLTSYTVGKIKSHCVKSMHVELVTRQRQRQRRQNTHFHTLHNDNNNDVTTPTWRKNCDITTITQLHHSIVTDKLKHKSKQHRTIKKTSWGYWLTDNPQPAHDVF